MSITERAAPRRSYQRSPEERKPAYIVRAPDPNNRGRWLTLGVAWHRRDGQDGFNVKLNTVPVGNAWDGTLVLLPPLPNDETAEEPQND